MEKTRENKSFKTLNQNFEKIVLTIEFHYGIIFKLTTKQLVVLLKYTEVNVMNTFMAKPAEIQRKWYIIDAADRPLGRTAAKVAEILRGKIKPEFTPHVDCGDHVVVINADKAVLTGNKLQKKFYRRHTGYIGGLKEVKYATLMATRPELAMELAVKGMVPDTTIGRKALTRLHVYSGTEYAQVAQKPEVYEF